MKQDTPQKLTEQEYADFKHALNKAKARLYKRAPFFGMMVMKMKTIPTYSIPTMAVDDNMNIFINPHFATKDCSTDEMLGVLAHEAFHIINFTFPRRRHRQHILWNIATDYIINRDIIETGLSLPKGVLLPVKQSDKWIIEDKHIGFKVDITDITSEQLYKILERVQKNAIQQLKAMQESLDKHLEDCDSKGMEPLETPDGDPTYSPNPANKDSKTRQDNAKRALADILDNLQKRNTRSNTGKFPRSFDANLLKPTVNWKVLIKNTFSKLGTTESTWQRPSRRAFARGYYAPSYHQIFDSGYVVIAVDTSGSVDELTLKRFVSEIVNIGRYYKKIAVRFIFWHTKVTADLLVDFKTTTPDAAIRQIAALQIDSGGTTISCVEEYLRENPTPANIAVDKADAFVALTDGFIEGNPVLPAAKKHIFLLIRGGSESVLNKFGPCHYVDF